MIIGRKDKERIEQLEAALAATLAYNEVLERRAYIVHIDRQQRMNRFTFQRGNETYTIETMGLISDNLPEWKGKLL